MTTYITVHHRLLVELLSRVTSVVFDFLNSRRTPYCPAEEESQIGRMKLIVGLFLLAAAALALPVPENEENKSGVPLVIADYSSVAKSEESHRHQDSSDSSEESSERPSEEAKLITEAAKIEEKREEKLEASSEENSSEESNESRPQQDENPASPEPIQTTEAPDAEEAPRAEGKLAEKEEKRDAPLEEQQPVVEPKLGEPELKIETPEPTPLEEKREEAAPAIKLVAEGDSDLVEAAKNEAALAGEPAAPALKLDLPSPAAEASAEKVETPLALPALKAEEKPEVAEIQQETALPSEQKVEAAPAAEEKLLELRKDEAAPEQELKVLDEKLDEKLEEKREEKKELIEKKSKAEEAETSEVPASAQPEEISNKDEPLATTEALPEKLPEPASASS